MSLRDLGRGPVLRVAAVAGVLALSSVLGGCGFQPLYGANSPTSTVSGELASIHIAEIRTRIGQQVRNRLISTMSPPGQERQALYRLELDPIESQRDVFVEPDTNVTRRNYKLQVRYTLYEAGSNRLLNKGSVFSIVSYDRVDSEFANVRALENAQSQASRVVADDIRTALAAFLASA